MKKTLFTILFFMCLLNIKAQNKKDSIPESSKDKIFTEIETPPEFPGGVNEFYNFLSNNIIYPAEAKKNNIVGRIIIRFVVEKDGSLRDLKVIRGVNKLLDDEALRVMELSPKWHPGIQKGKAVRCEFVVPISFSLK